jgi:acetyl-CoA carboxylase carboxyltransferase component
VDRRSRRTPGSFREQGPIAGDAETAEDGSLRSFSPGNYVLGIARIDGRPCVGGGEDFTQRGGSPTPAGLRKSIYAEDVACRYRLPLVHSWDAAAAALTGATRSRKASAGEPVYGRHRFESIARAMATAAVVSAAVGAVAAFPRPASSPPTTPS